MLIGARNCRIAQRTDPPTINWYKHISDDSWNIIHGSWIMSHDSWPIMISLVSMIILLLSFVIIQHKPIFHVFLDHTYHWHHDMWLNIIYIALYWCTIQLLVCNRNQKSKFHSNTKCVLKCLPCIAHNTFGLHNYYVGLIDWIIPWNVIRFEKIHWTKMAKPVCKKRSWGTGHKFRLWGQEAVL